MGFMEGYKRCKELIIRSCTLKRTEITSSLSEFYTQSAQKWTGTRQRSRPEFDHIITEIKSYQKDGSLFICELGCGDGRFAEYLEQHLGRPFHYVGVDCSHGLIAHAKKRDLGDHCHFVVSEMNAYLGFLEQQSADIVISIASMQHLHFKHRLPHRKHIYRVLHYEGLYITVNRSYSLRLLRKHWMSLLSGFVAMIMNPRCFSFGDALIPFQQKIQKLVDPSQSPLGLSVNSLTSKMETFDKIDYRFYHFFSTSELRRLSKSAGLSIGKSAYINSLGHLSDKLRQSRNSFIVARKTV